MTGSAETAVRMEEFFKTEVLMKQLRCFNHHYYVSGVDSCNSCFQKQLCGLSSEEHVLNLLRKAEVEEVKSVIDKISSQAEEVKALQCIVLSSTQQDKGNKDKLERLNNEVKKNANVVRVKLKLMQKNWPVDEESTSTSVFQRIHNNQHSHLTRCFAEVMRSYHKSQMSFRDKCKAQIQRQLEIVDKVTTDEELEEMLQCDRLSIFISDIKPDAHTSSHALSEIECRHRDIISLESSIKDLHDVFADTAMLLEIQGEVINNIEKNVTSAAEYVDESKAEINKAVKYKKHRFKIASRPSFLQRFKKQTSADTSTDQNLNSD